MAGVSIGLGPNEIACGALAQERQGPSDGGPLAAALLAQPWLRSPFERVRAIGFWQRQGPEMLHELVLAIGIPLLLLLMAVLALEHGGESLPPWLQRLSQRPSLVWNGGVGLIIVLSLVRWWLKR